MDSNLSKNMGSNELFLNLLINFFVIILFSDFKYSHI